MSEFTEDFIQRQACHARDLIAVVTRMDSRIQQPRRRALQLLIESIPETIKGFNNNLTVVVSEDGQIKSVERDQLTPEFGYIERYGKAIELAFNQLVDQYVKDGVTFDMMVFEPEATGTQIVSAWHCKEMAVSRLIAAEAKRDLTVPCAEPGRVTVNFTGKVETGLHVIEYAKELLSKINLVGSNPHKSQPS